MVKEMNKFRKDLKDNRMKNRKGFTLVELLAVFIILAIIAGIAIGSMNNVKENVTVNVYKESVKNAINAAQNYYSENGDSSSLKSGISIFSKDLSIENKDQYKSGIIVYNDSTGKLEAKNISDGSYCANGPIDNLKIVEGACPSTDTACFKYAISSNRVTITGYDYSNTSCYGDVNIPSKIEGYPVTKIGFGAFADIDSSKYSYCSRLNMPDSSFYKGEESVTKKPSLLSNSHATLVELGPEKDPSYMDYYCIPYTISYEYDEARLMAHRDIDMDYNYVGDRGYKINNVTIPSTVTYIDNLAFAKTGLIGVNFSSLSNLTYIGDTSFIFTNISNVDLSGLSRLQTIGFYAFSKSGVESVDLTNISNLKEIRVGAFDYNQISTINFTGSDNIVHIGSSAFARNQINNVIINNLTKLVSLGYRAFCDNPFYYNDNYPLVNNLMNLDSYQLGEACLSNNEER